MEREKKLLEKKNAKAEKKEKKRLAKEAKKKGSRWWPLPSLINYM